MNSASGCAGLYMISLITTQSSGRGTVPVYSIVMVSVAPGTSSPRRSRPVKTRILVRPPSGTVICQFVMVVQVIGNGTPFTSIDATAIGAQPVRLTVGSLLTKSAPPLLVMVRVGRSVREGWFGIVGL